MYKCSVCGRSIDIEKDNHFVCDECGEIVCPDCISDRGFCKNCTDFEPDVIYCHVCGRICDTEDGDYEVCDECGHVVCPDCFDRYSGLCRKCLM